MVTLTPHGAGLAFRFPYDARMVAYLKAEVPAESRSWDAAGKFWLVDPRYGAKCAELALRCTGQTVRVPTIAPPERVVEMLRLDYIGTTKTRSGSAEPSAFGLVGGEWAAVFPESVLRAWFDPAPRQPGQAATLYGVLGVAKDADEAAIRSVFRRLARQWHPDVCHEPNAAEQYKGIQAAYETLTDRTKRQRYDGALAMVAHMTDRGWQETANKALIDTGYQPPLRCGYVLVEGVRAAGRFVVSKIEGWEDIEREDGKVLASYWDKTTQCVVLDWR